MYEHNALGYRLGLALCLTKVRSSRARCPATALISYLLGYYWSFNFQVNGSNMSMCIAELVLNALLGSSSGPCY